MGHHFTARFCAEIALAVLVRRCAYRLAELYAQAGRAKDCVKMLKWLEKEDDTFKVEKEG